ncbi:PREDICTED: mesencephalic astrocyte-derived neurotrophic factor-like [Amphimedon queenslandica]|uniref:Mesencephalic astrocyte-derived neurotrophic factor homolog n=1 Tax=Amphimedon queenslandica TaxID=400682 RepID=A0A1X7TYG8_AMPQE|nr:PREDICTED: mesencephalic astrocyte-derived neurotrophic factor-like [Amphimedon queenslandica]|eukprot:XP_003389510.1 PREDICTED: mesencephalic astrocyte-derived neurotrophic factor-like [Amphimedon queenslandica]
MKGPLVLLCLAVAVSYIEATSDCPVCVGVLTKFQEYAGKDVEDMEKSEAALIKFCKTLKGKEDSFCYYIGASETSATRIIGQVTKPLSYGKPVEKICKDLKKKDTQICELKYEEKIDISNIDLWTLPVKKLKKILTGWGEHCKGCLEKSDLIAKINQVKDSHLEL